MRRDDKVGLINKEGDEIIPPLFEDLKTLDAKLCAVRKDEKWLVVNFEGKVLIDRSYEQVEVWDSEYIGYRSNGLWGITHLSGDEISLPTYDLITYFGEGHFLLHQNGSKGLMNKNGKIILEPLAETIAPLDQQLFIFQKDKAYGLVSATQGIIKPAEYNQVEPLGYNFLVLRAKDNLELFSISDQSVIHQGRTLSYYELNESFILVGKDNKLGLLDRNGNQLLNFDYDEIQLWTDQHFRISKNGEWGVVDLEENFLVEPEYEYIGPLQNNIAHVRNFGKAGLINIHGEVLFKCDFDEVTINKGEARAAYNEDLTIINIDELGREVNQNNFKNHVTITIGKKENSKKQLARSIENKYQVKEFEWFYSAKTKGWGMRKLADGSIQIPPKFDWIKIDDELNITLVGKDQVAYQNFEFTSFRFEQVYGIVNNHVGQMIGEMQYWDIKLEDFHDGNALARVVLKNGRHGLIDKLGILKQRDFAFIGPFIDGRARMSAKGNLSGTASQDRNGLGKLSHYLGRQLSPNLMIDYTRYDQYFEDEAQLTCEGCEWGYLDKAGDINISPNYEYASDFRNEVGIVRKNNKWGVINAKDELVLECKYDAISFLENTNERILKVTTNSEKYGIIDTLGQVLVDLQYDEIGHFSEGRLAVRRNGLWGFVNQYGQEIIPCRFRTVNPFQEGLATVKLSSTWGVIDKQGDKVIDFKFSKIGNFVNGLVWVNQKYKIGFINKEGQFAIPAKFDKAFDFEGELARVVVKGKYGLINTKGEFVLRPRFSRIEDFNQHGTAIVKQHGNQTTYGLIDRRGNLLTFQNFSLIQGFQEGMAVVRLKGDFGFINTKGDLVVKNKYSKASDFSNGRAMVQNNGVCGYIDVQGTEVVELQYSK